MAKLMRRQDQQYGKTDATTCPAGTNNAGAWPLSLPALLWPQRRGIQCSYLHPARRFGVKAARPGNVLRRTRPVSSMWHRGEGHRHEGRWLSPQSGDEIKFDL